MKTLLLILAFSSSAYGATVTIETGGSGSVSVGSGGSGTVTFAEAGAAPPTPPAECEGDTIVDVDFADLDTGGNISAHVPVVGGSWVGTDANNGELVWDTANDWAESDSPSDGVHKFAWLNDDIAFDVFTATVIVNSTTGGTSTRNGVLIITPKPGSTRGYEGYRAHLGSGNFIFEKCDDEVTCETLISSAQTNASEDRTIHVTRSESGEWKWYALGTLRGTVTDTTYGVTRFGMYIRNVGALKSIIGTCQ